MVETGDAGAVLAGGLTSCAFLALLRFTQLTAAAGEGIYANRLLIAIGLLSMAVAGALLAQAGAAQVLPLAIHQLP